MKIKEICKTCQFYNLEENGEEQFGNDPCIVCIKNPEHRDYWELEKDLIKNCSQNEGQ